jgi:hypothetical protein
LPDEFVPAVFVDCGCPTAFRYGLFAFAEPGGTGDGSDDLSGDPILLTLPLLGGPPQPISPAANIDTAIRIFNRPIMTFPCS